MQQIIYKGQKNLLFNIYCTKLNKNNQFPFGKLIYLKK
jgi:hypothetical protein